MRAFRSAALTSLVLPFAVAACSSDAGTPATSDAGADTTAMGSLDASSSSSVDAATDAARGAGRDAAPCRLTNDPGAPGQYADRCVERGWIQAYSGTYASNACELTVSVSGTTPATFTMKVLSGAQAGTYVIEWEGGVGAGNDSYFRFTTDATFATTKSLFFNAGQAVTGGERNAGLRVSGIDTGTVAYSGSYAQTIGGVTTEVDCGKLTRR